MTTTLRALARPAAAAALALTTALTLAACGDDSTGDPKASSSTGANVPASADFNDADVAFATDMIQHHAQALAMVDLTEGRTLSPEVAALAEQIREAQTPEIETMTGWLNDWDQPVPETVRDHVNGGHSMDGMDGMDGMDDSSGMDHGSGHGSGDMPGMMSAEQMDALAAAGDAEFERQWLQMMVEHHEGAVAMARTEVADGEDDAAVALATTIISSQREEIATMKGLLG